MPDEGRPPQPTKKEKHNDKDTGAPWFWVGFGIIVAGGAGFIIYKKVGRKNV